MRLFGNMLKRKCFRDIKNNLSQFVTIFLMIFIGVMAYCGIEAYMMGMQKTASEFYKVNNLQDLNVIGSNFSKDDLNSVKNLKHVKNAERKLSVTGRSKNKILLLNFIETNEISKFYVIEGDKFDCQKGVWLDSFYASKNNIKVGDYIDITYDTFTLKEIVRGLINVPDHVYDTKDESEIYPDHKEFGFAYLSSSEIPEYYIKQMVMQNSNIDEKTFDFAFKNFNYKDYIPYNYIMVDTSSKSKAKQEIENKIKPLAVQDIKDTVSYRTYQGEIDEGKTYVGVFSGLFLFIATLSVITTMTRVIDKQRIQIGILKALGFKDRQITIHYISYGFWISIFSCICGLIAGYYFIGNIFINMEMEFFEMPNGRPYMNYNSYFVSLLMVLLVSFITYMTCRKTLKKSPADSLRNEIPTFKHPLKMNRGIFKKLSFNSKWNIRDVFRNKMRTIMGIVGVTGCGMLLICSLGMLDSMNNFIDLQFDKIYNFKYKATVKDVDKLSDKYTSQTLGIEIKKDGKVKANNVFVTDAGNLIRFVDNKDKFIKLDSKEGVYVTYKFAKTNNYKKGDYIYWHIYGRDKYYKSKIIGFNKDPQNQNMTMTRQYLESLSIKYVPDTVYSNEKIIDGVSYVQKISSLRKSTDKMLSTMQSMIVLLIVVAVILGVVIIYNLGILSYTEKEYQFATLKVLGFKDGQLRRIFIKQNNWIAVISIILSIPLGYYLTDYLFRIALEDHYDFSAHINLLSYVYASLFTFVISYIVSTLLANKINKIDMVSGLKGNE